MNDMENYSLLSEVNYDHLRYTDPQRIQQILECNKKMYIYVHVPKSAGSFIKSVILKSEKTTKILCPFQRYDQSYYQIPLHILNHPTISLLYNLIPNSRLSEVGFFSVVRNPFDRTYSLWKWLNSEVKPFSNQSCPADKDILFLRTLIPVPNTFEKFLYKMQEGYFDYSYFAQPQYHYFLGSENSDVKIFKMEEMNKIRDFMFENGIKTWSDKKVNDIPSKNYKEVYDEKMLDIVREKYRKDFETFNYSMDL